MRQLLFPNRHNSKAIIGMVHLRALPGAPGWAGSMPEVTDAALRDAEALVAGGVDGIIVENYGDTPFFPGVVPPVTVASITAAVALVRNAVEVPVGVNVLRNDAAAALGVCAASGATFLRVNVHTGAMITDQGLINGTAHDTLRLRREICPQAAIFADVFVKHATPPPGLTIEDAALDTWERGHADALIVTGSGTGRPTSADAIAHVHAAVPAAPIFIGSGLSTTNATELLSNAAGAIVGSAFKVDGRAGSRVAVEKVRALMDVVAAIR